MISIRRNLKPTHLAVNVSRNSPFWQSRGIQLYKIIQLTLPESLRDKETRLQGGMGNLLRNLPNLGYGLPLQIDKCLWYFHPSYGSDSRDITAESQRMYNYPN